MTAIEWPLTNWAPLAPSFCFWPVSNFTAWRETRGSQLALFPPCALAASVAPAVAIVVRAVCELRIPIRDILHANLHAKFPVVDDPESRNVIFLTKYRDPVDRERFETDCGKAIPQHRQDGLASFAVKSTRQCHVEAEVFHYIWISPAIELFALSRRQVRRISPRTIFGSERRTEWIEFADAIGGKPDKFGRWRR